MLAAKDGGPAARQVPAAAGAKTPPGGSANLTRGIGLFVVMSRLPSLTEPGILTVNFMFQCPPLEEFAKQASYNHNDFDTVRWGQYSRRQGVQLRTVEFNTMVLSDTPSWSNIAPDPVNFSARQQSSWKPNIHAMCDELEAICRSGTPFRLHAYQPRMWGHKAELEWNATLRALTIAQRAGEPESRYISASFTEWRKIGVNEKNKGPTGTSPAGKTVGTNTPTKQAGGNSAPAKGSTTQYVQASSLVGTSQSLYDLSKKAYGTTTLWVLIAAANPALANLPPSQPIAAALSQDMKIVVPRL